MSNSLFSKAAQEQLKQLKSELSKGRKESEIQQDSAKPLEHISLPSKQQVTKQVKKYDSEYLNDDKLLFMQAMAGVRPIDNKNLANHQKSFNKPDVNMLAKRMAAQGNSEENSQQLSDMQAFLNPVSGDAYLTYKTATLQNKIFNQLKQGKIRWYDAVDLHGATIEEAREAVIKLIKQARNNQENCVKIVHGKGTDGILKTCVNGWLRQIPDVLAFCSAPSEQGGNGAVLVLLKRKNYE